MKKCGAAVETFVSEYTESFGFAPCIETPDAVQLNRIYGMDSDGYRDLVRAYLRMADPFLERNGYSGRMLTGKVVNAIRLKQTAARRLSPQQKASGAEYAAKLRQWEEENEVMPMTVNPLPRA